MSITREQYNLIQREYDRRRLEARHGLEARIKKAEEQIPALKEINERMASASINYAKLSLSKEPVDFEELKLLNHALALEKEKLLKANGFPADYLKPHYRCPFCNDTGFEGSGYCRCFQQAVVDLLYSQSFLRQRLREENFSTFCFDYYDDTKNPRLPNQKTPYQNIQEVVMRCRAYIKNFPYSCENILVYGKTGVGKTFLSNCIAKEILDQGNTVIYLSAPQLFEIIETHKFSKSPTGTQENAETKMRYILDCDLLIIDDLGTEFNNSFISSQLYYCINERFLRQKSTLISTNLSFEEIRKNYSDRIYSRLFHDYMPIKIYGDDIRIKKVLM